MRGVVVGKNEDHVWSLRVGGLGGGCEWPTDECQNAGQQTQAESLRITHRGSLCVSGFSSRVFHLFQDGVASGRVFLQDFVHRSLHARQVSHQLLERIAGDADEIERRLGLDRALRGI